MTDAVVRFGKYTLLDRVGSGGMAEIWRASLESIDNFQKILCVKKILPKYAHNRQFITMFIQEAKVCSGLHHANVVQIYELGEHEGVYYMAMEYVAGWDLLQILTRASKAKRRLPAELCCYIAQEVCKGLAYAHAATDLSGKPLDIVHLDCSPSNILLSHDGDVKLTDFGVARASVDGAPSGRDDRLKGKLGYMSPEQVTGKPLDSRSDLFSLGIILYELFTLKRLFLGRTDLETLSNIRDADVESRLTRHPEIPAGIQTIIRRALSVNVDTRYQTALEMEDAISQYLFEQRTRVSGQKLANWLRELDRSPVPLPPAVASTAAPPIQRARTVGLQKPPAAPEPPPLVPDLPAAARSTEVSQRRPLSSPGLIEQHRYQFRTGPDSEPFGPVPFENFASLIRSRSVAPDELVSVDGQSWRELREVTDFDRLRPAWVAPVRPQPDSEGMFGPENAPRMVVRLAAGGRTGCLCVTRRGCIKEVYFRRGKPVYISTNDKTQLFGAILVREGAITQRQLDEAVAMTARSPSLPLGQLLLQQGAVEPMALFTLLDRQFKEKFMRIFAWQDASYEYYRDLEPPEDAVPYSIDPFPAIAEGIRQYMSVESLERYFSAAWNGTIRLRPTPPFDLGKLKLMPREFRVTNLLATRPKTVKRLLQEAGQGDEARRIALFVLFLLHQAEHIEIR